MTPDSPVERHLLVARLARLWRRLTEPHPAIVDPGQRRQVRLLRVLFIGLIVLTVGYELWYLTGILPSARGWSDPKSLLVLAGLALLSLAYWVSRTPRYLWAIAFFVAAANLLMLAVVVVSADSSLDIAWLLFGLLVCSLFFSPRVTALLLAAICVGVVILPQLAFAPSWFDIVDAEIFFVSNGLLIVAVAVARRQDLKRSEEQTRVLVEQGASLRESEARYRSLFEDSPVAMWEFDDSAVKAHLEELAAMGIDDVIGHVRADPQEYAHCVSLSRGIDANGAAVRLFEAADREELLARDRAVYRTANDRGIHRFWAVMLAAGARSAAYEETSLTLRGNEIRILETGTVVPGHEATFDRVYVADVDVSERRRAQEELEMNRRHLALVYETAGDVLFLLAVEGEERYRFVTVNPAFLSVTGLQAEQVVGKRTDEVLPLATQALVIPKYREAIREHKTVRWEEVSEYPTGVLYGEVAVTPAYDESGACTHLVGMVHDVTATRRAEQALRDSEERYRILAETSPDLIFIVDRQQRALYANAAAARSVGRAAEAVVGVLLADLFDAETVASMGTSLRRVFASGEAVQTESELSYPTGTRWVDTWLVPLTDDGGQVNAVLGVSRDITPRKQAEEEVRHQAQRLRRTVEGAVLAMSQVVEIRDPYTAGHERRVAELATAIAAQMGIDGEALEALRHAALIHDIGKIAVPAEILSKPGRLSEIEFELIKQHSRAGFEILAAIDFGRPVAEIVLQHHERLDGSGYPQGLAGADTLPEAKILAVADVVEAMSSHRPYRAALGMEAALAEIREHAGVKYDAEVAAACFRLVAEQGFAFSS